MKTLQLKQAEAKERQEFYNSLTLHGKIAWIESRPGSARKQLKKLRKEYEASKR